MATWCCDSKSGRAPGVSLEDLDGDVRRGVLEYSTCIRFPSYDSLVAGAPLGQLRIGTTHWGMRAQHVPVRGC